MKPGVTLYYVVQGDDPDEFSLGRVTVCFYDGNAHWYKYGGDYGDSFRRVEWWMASTEAEAWKRERERRVQAVRDAESRLYNLDLFLESNRDR